MSRHEPPRLTVGDRCVLMSRLSLYDVEVSEVHVNLQGDPLEFAMYRVKSLDRGRATWFEGTSQHRSDLFRLPAERPLLIERIESDIDALQYLLHEQEKERDDEDEAAQHERAADTAAEVNRD